MDNLSWQIGDVKVTRITELEMPTSARFLFDDLTKEMLLGIDWRSHISSMNAATC